MQWKWVRGKLCTEEMLRLPLARIELLQLPAASAACCNIGAAGRGRGVQRGASRGPKGAHLHTGRQLLLSVQLLVLPLITRAAALAVDGNLILAAPNLHGQVVLPAH